MEVEGLSLTNMSGYAILYVVFNLKDVLFSLFS